MGKNYGHRPYVMLYDFTQPILIVCNNLIMLAFIASTGYDNKNKV